MCGPNYKRSLDAAETGSKLRLYEQSKITLNIAILDEEWHFNRDFFVVHACMWPLSESKWAWLFVVETQSQNFD